MEEAISLLIRFRFNWWFIKRLLNTQGLTYTRIDVVVLTVAKMAMVVDSGRGGYGGGGWQ